MGLYGQWTALADGARPVAECCEQPREPRGKRARQNRSQGEKGRNGSKGQRGQKKATHYTLSSTSLQQQPQQHFQHQQQQQQQQRQSRRRGFSDDDHWCPPAERAGHQERVALLVVNVKDFSTKSKFDNVPVHSVRQDVREFSNSESRVAEAGRVHTSFTEFDRVIFASGGFGADFTSSYLPATCRSDLLHLPTTNGEHCTGDAIKMCEAIGNKTIDLEWVQVHPTGLVKLDDPDAKIKFLATEALHRVGTLVFDTH